LVELEKQVEKEYEGMEVSMAEIINEKNKELDELRKAKNG
jgi:hypothetical protein